jgi:RNA polymerase sigma-70 factor (ECF subfamily)
MRAVPLNEHQLAVQPQVGADGTFDPGDQLRRALDALPAHHREAVVLRYVEEMTYEEISRVVGCPVGTVRSRLHYARDALRNLLEEMKIHE